MRASLSVSCTLIVWMCCSSPGAVGQNGSQPANRQTSSSQASAAAVVAATPATETAACLSSEVNTTLDTPTLNPVEAGANAVSGSVSKGSVGTVQLCSNGAPLGGPAQVDSTTGAFSVTGLAKMNAGEKIQAQFIEKKDANDVFGMASSELVVGSCLKSASASGTAPTLSVSVDASNVATFSGTGTAKGIIRICVNNVQNGSTVTVGPDGKFSGGTNSFKVSLGDKIVAQSLSADTPPQYGLLSNEVVLGNVAVGGQESNKAVLILIGGVEYSGYSAQSQTTNGFLSMFYRGPASHGFSGWGRIRLTSAPQAATNGVVSVISNPTGLTTYDYSNVGQVLDYVFGPQYQIRKSNWSIVGGLGATTPLSSQNAPVTFVAPPPGTVECTELVSRFSAANGYNPALTLNTATTPTTCLAGAYTDIAFANQDRSNFFLKYGAGLRATYPWTFGNCNGTSGSNCSKAYSALDVTLGQDSSVTGGYLRGVVFKLDGTLPIPTGSSSWLYLFGSSYVRLQSNQNLPPLILQTPPTTVTVPSPTVIVLPLRQPNRDYYRIGVGLNISQLWCKAFGSGCSTSTNTQNSGSTTTTTPATKPTTKTKSSS